MIKTWVFAAGAAIGYVLGTRAGRERYDKMAAHGRQILENPKVKEATDAVQAEATRLYDEGKQAVRERVRKVSLRNGRQLNDVSPLAATTTPIGQGGAATTDYPSTG